MDLKDVKVAICLPHTDITTLSPFIDSFFCMARPFDHVYLRPTGNAPLDYTRNELVRRAMLVNATHIFMADCDQVYPMDTLVKLVERDLDIVGGKVHRRFEPYDPLLFRGEQPNLHPVPEEEWARGDLVEVDATGTGCLLVKIDVFKKIPEPWFLMRVFENPPVGEDIHFMGLVKNSGYKVYVDCGIKVGHLAISMITESHYWEYKRKKQNPHEEITNMRRVV